LKIIVYFSLKRTTMTSQPTLPKRPNFILFMTDQQRSIDPNLEIFPSKWISQHLPNYSKFLATGAVFGNNICNASPCGPSRASLFSGMYPANNGVTSNEGTISPSQMNFANVLNSAAYDVHYMGKLHMREEFTSFSTAWPQKLDTAAMSALDQNALLKNYYGMKSWTSPDFGTTLVQGTDLTQSQLHNLAGGTYGNDQRVIDGTGNLNTESPTVMSVLKYLETKAASGDPFCLVISLLNPHDISLFPDGWEQAGYPPNFWEEYDLATLTLPKTYDKDTLKDKPSVQVAYLNSFCHGALNEEWAKKYLQFYAYLHIQSDKLLGKVMDSLSSSLLDNTVLIRLADHGEMAMSHGGLQEKSFTMYNETIKVPMIWWYKGIESGPRDQMVSLIDLVPTIGTLAGADLSKFPELQGKDYSQALLNPKQSGFDHSVFSFAFSPPPNSPTSAGGAGSSTLSDMYTKNPYAAPGTSPADYPNNIYAYLSNDHKFGIYYSLDSNNYVNWKTAQFELYDRTSDPVEMTNMIPIAAPGQAYDSDSLKSIKYHYDQLTRHLKSRCIILPLGWEGFYDVYEEKKHVSTDMEGACQLYKGLIRVTR